MVAYVPTKVLHSSPLKKPTHPHKGAYLSENGGLGKQKSEEWAKRIRQKEHQD